MKRSDALALIRTLIDAYPGTYYRDLTGTINVYTERLARWDAAAAQEAVERLIDTSRAFPSVADLREAYRAAGGHLADPGRDMSPPLADHPPLSPEESAEVSKLRAQVRRLIADRAGTLAAGDQEGSVE